MAAWPKLDADISESGTIRIGKGTTAFARATRLGPDLQLIVAREPADGGALLRRVMLVFLAGGALFIAVVRGLGRFGAGRLPGLIQRVKTAFREERKVAVAGKRVSVGVDHGVRLHITTKQ